jgi:hypothetical protein
MASLYDPGWLYIPNEYQAQTSKIIFNLPSAEIAVVFHHAYLKLFSTPTNSLLFQQY